MAWAEIIKALMAVGMVIAQSTPGPIENRMRKQLKADEKRMAGGGGGYAEGSRQSQMAGVANTVQAQQQQALAQLARGSATGGGESGMSAMRQGNVFSGGQMAMQRGASDVRAADLAFRDQQMQLMLQRQMALAAMGQKRKDNASASAEGAMKTNGTSTQMGMQSGANARGSDAQNATNMANMQNMMSAGV